MKAHLLKRIFIFAAIAVSGSALTWSCVKDPDPELSVTPSVAAAVFSADGRDLTADGASISAEFAVETNQDSWSAQVSPSVSWFKITDTAAGFTVTAGENATGEQRGPITVTVSAGKAAPITISFTQSAIEETLVVTPAARTITFSADGQTAHTGEKEFDPVFTVDTNIDSWRVEARPSDSWLTVTVSDVGFVVAADENSSADERGPVVVTVSAGDIAPVEIMFTQDGKKFEVVELANVAIAVTVYHNSWYDEGDAYYYRGGEMNLLSRKAMSRKIVSSGSDIYVAGIVYDDEWDLSPVYWKNGELIKLPYEDDYVEIVAMAESDGNVYILAEGLDFGQFVLWKNGDLMEIPINPWSTVQLFGLTVEGDDLYIAGIIHINDKYRAAYWKNGQLVLLSDMESTALAISVSGSDVYVAGIIDDDESGIKYVYWKNGQMTVICDGKNMEFDPGLTMFVSGSDVYTCGCIIDELGRTSAVYWRNDTMVTLSAAGEYAVAFDIAVDGNDVYAVGLIMSSSGLKAVCWKNGNRYDLSDEWLFSATSITLLK